MGYYFGESQNSNLIKNSSFEKYSIQIDCNGGFDVAGVPSTYHIVDYWNTYNSPDYFNAICSAGGYNVPYNTFGNSDSKHGNAYAGLGVYLAHPTLDLEEYIYQQLTSPLKQDSVYCLSFFVSYSDRAVIAIKNIGASFSSSMHSTTSTGYINTVPQVVNNSGFLTDTINWVEIKGCFIAQGGELYLTIGNFNSNINTDTLHTKTTNPFPSGGIDISYYYIDSVSLWQNNFPTKVNEFTKEHSFNLYPNPNNGTMQFNYSVTKKAEFIITDVTGRIVTTYILDETQRSIVIKEQELNAGVYFYTVKQNSHILKQAKFVIMK
jgi:hypothetical protein